MKKFLVTLLAAATFGGAFAQSSFPDVPENHWAGGAVDRIADLGIVIGFPDGTFRGNEAFTRYQSALVVSRLLDVIGEELDARQALVDSDLAALANAVAANDAAIAAIGDDVAVNSARLDAIEAGLAGGDAAAAADLQNQIDALRVAVDTASAQAEAAHDLATNALGAARAAASRAAQNADAIAALSWFANDLEGRVNALEGAPAGDAGLAARLATAENDIANIREFVILIRRDQVAMRGQISALEGQVGTNTADIADLQDRVALLEENMITFDGSITVNYRVNRMSGTGTPFDVDRAFGVGMGRAMGTGSTFSTGTGPGAAPAIERRAEHRHDIGTEFNDPINASLNLNVSFNRVFDGTGSEGALNDFEAVLDLYLRPIDITGLTNTAPHGAPQTGYVFGIREFSGTFSPIGDAPLTFTYGEAINVGFTSYVFNQTSASDRGGDKPGFIATLENPVAFLDFLDPTLTFAYVAPDSLDEVFTGVRLTVSPFDGIAIGASFARYADGTADQDDLAGDNITTTVWGVDASAAISIFSLDAEFATSSTYDAATATTVDNESVIYVTAGVDTENIPVLNSLSANYRSIPETWVTEGLNDHDDYFPYEEDQTGFGVNASLGLWILDLSAYFDSYTTSVVDAGGTDAAGVVAFGVDVSAELFRAVSLTGFFHSASVAGEVADSTRRPYDSTSTLLVGGGATRIDRDGSLDTGFGVGLAHDGTADNALVAGLNFDAGFSMVNAGFQRTVIEANADYELSLGFLRATPYVGFYSANSDPANLRPYEDYNVSEISAGLGLETDEFDFFLRPSLVAAVNYRSANYSDNGGLALGGGAGDFNANEFQFSVGVALNEFLFDNSVLTVRYGSWAGTNVDAGIGTHVGSNASLIHRGDVNNTGDQFVNGWEAIWDYYDLQFAYGVYLSDDGRGASAGQTFRVRYTVDF